MAVWGRLGMTLAIHHSTFGFPLRIYFLLLCWQCHCPLEALAWVTNWSACVGIWASLVSMLQLSEDPKKQAGAGPRTVLCAELRLSHGVFSSFL